MQFKLKCPLPPSEFIIFQAFESPRRFRVFLDHRRQVLDDPRWFLSRTLWKLPFDLRFYSRLHCLCARQTLGPRLSTANASLWPSPRLECRYPHPHFSPARPWYTLYALRTGCLGELVGPQCCGWENLQGNFLFVSISMYFKEPPIQRTFAIMTHLWNG